MNCRNWVAGMVFPETTSEDEGEMGGGKMIVSSIGTVIQWASLGFSSLPGHVVGLGELNRRRQWWMQSKNVVEDLEKAKEQTN